MLELLHWAAAGCSAELELISADSGVVLVKRRRPLPRLARSAATAAAWPSPGSCVTLADFMQSEFGSKSSLRFPATATQEEFLGWLGRVAGVEQRNGQAFKSKCRQRAALQQPRWATAVERWRRAVEQLGV